MKSIIRNFIAKMVAGRSDDGIMITLKDPKKVEFQAAMMEDFLMRNGIDPRAIQSEEQLKMILNQINNINQPTSGVRGTESAKVFNRMGEELDPNQPIIGGTQPGKSIDTDTFSRLAETNTQRMKQKIADKKIDTDVDTIVKNIKSMEPMTAMKEANSVIGRKGKYKNLTPEQSKKILKDTEDHIFERDVKPSEFDPDIEDRADGGRIGLKGGADASQFDKSPSEQRSVDISPGGGVTLGSGPPEGPDDRGNNDNRPPPVKKTIPPEIKKAVNLGGDISYLKNLIELNPVGIIKNIGGKILFDKITGDQTSLDTEDDDTGIMKMADATTTPTADTMGLNLMDRKTLKDAGYSNNQIQELQNNPNINTQDVIRDIKGPIFAAASGGRAGLKGVERILKCPTLIKSLKHIKII